MFVFDLVQHTDQFTGAVPKWKQHSLHTLRWSASDKVLVADDGNYRSPIWALPAQPDSHAEIIMDDGYLIDVLPDYSAVYDVFATDALRIPNLTPTPGVVVIVNVTLLNVRSGPGLNYSIIGRASLGGQYTIQGGNHDGTWWQIDFNDQEGWVFGELVTPQNTDAVAVMPQAAPSASPGLTPVATSTTLPPLRGCWSQPSGHQLEGRLYVNGKPANGYAIAFSDAPDGPIVDKILSGPHEEHRNWDTGYFNYTVDTSSGGTNPRDRYAWIVDENDQRLSEIVHWQKSCNRIWAVLKIHIGSQDRE